MQNDRESNGLLFAPGMPPHVSTIRLYLIAFGMFGLQYCWAIQVGVTTSVLLQLGLSERWVSVAWLAGPVAGLVAQPLVGMVSDRLRSRLGRRRPFIVMGSALTSVSLLAFAYARELSEKVFGCSALTVSIIAFWCLDFSINIAQGPLRALIYDVVPADEQERGNAALAFFNAFGNLVGNTLGGFELTHRVFPHGWFSDDGQALFVIGSVIMTVSTLVCVIAGASSKQFIGREEVLRSDMTYTEDGIDTLEETRNKSVPSLMVAIQHAPPLFWRVFLIQMCTWYAWFTFFVYGSSWFGVDVYGGDPHAPWNSTARERFQDGVHVANMALALQNVLAIIYSVALPYLFVSLGPSRSTKWKYLLSQAVQSGSLLLISLVGSRSIILAVILFAALGISWASTMTIPWSIIGQQVNVQDYRDAAGTYATLLNASQCLPEVIVSLSSPIILQSRTFSDRQPLVLAFGGVVAFLGWLFVMRLPLE